MLLEISGEIIPERLKRPRQSKNNTQLWMWLVMEVVWCCKEQYCIGTWIVRSMNQGKLEVVKQGMARVNVNILRISELKWTGMGKFNSDDHCVYYSGQEYRSGFPFPSPEILPTQGSNLGLLHCRQMLHRLSHQGSPYIYGCVCVYIYVYIYIYIVSQFLAQSY